MGIVKTQILSGVFYTALSRYVGIVVQLAVTAILARLLSPIEFGVIAICTVVVAFFNRFTEMGIGVAVIQRQDLEKKDYNQLYSFSVYLGLFLGFIFFILSYPISRWYHQPDLCIYLHLLSLQLVFSTFNMIPNAILLKAKKFKFIAGRTFVLQIITGILACLAAYCGWGCYALLISPIITSISVYLINIRMTSLNFSFTFYLTPLKKIFSYSLYQFAFGMINYFSRNLDKLLTGRYISMNQLGFYEKSYRLVLLPMQNISGVINPVVQPVLSEFQSDKQRLGNYLLKILKAINMVCFPISVVSFFCSKEIILLFFGDQWYAAVPCFQILSLSIGFQASLHITGAFFQVANSTKGLFWTGLLTAIENIVGFIIAVKFWNSIEAVATAVSIVFAVSFFQTYLVLFSYIYKNMVIPFLRSLSLPIFICVIIILMLIPVMYLPLKNLWLSAGIKVFITVILLLTFYHISGFLKLSHVVAYIRKK